MLDQLFQSADQEVKRATLALAERHPSVFDCFLDCGHGNGQFTTALAHHMGMPHVYVADCQITRVYEANKRGWHHPPCITTDLNKSIDYPDGFFDVIHAGQIIEHLSNTDTFVREIYRVLKFGGYCLISTPNLASWHNILWLLLGKQPHVAMVSDEIIRWKLADDEVGEPKHRRLFTLEGLAMLFEHHGFMTEVIMGTGFYPFPSVIAKCLSRIDKWHSVYLVGKFRKVAGDN